MVVTVSLWVDQLINNTIGDLADFQTLYKVTSFITLIVSVQNVLVSCSDSPSNYAAISAVADDGR